MSKHGSRRRRDEPEEPTEPQPLQPDRVEGRAAFCKCGSSTPMELPGPTRADRERMRAGTRVWYELHCPGCVALVRVEDPWEPRDSGRS